MRFNKGLYLLLFLLSFLVPLFSLGEKERPSLDVNGEEYPMEKKGMDTLESAVLGGGCFWCLEAVYEKLDGVEEVLSGYAGGSTKNPTYQEVSSGLTGHAEVVRILFNPARTSYEEILNLFWRAHDPASLNRQGADIGTQYRSVIFYSTEEQERVAQKSLADKNLLPKYSGKIVTQIEKLTSFYPAEEYHQNYYEKNPNSGYCQVVIYSKLQKLGLTDKF